MVKAGLKLATGLLALSIIPGQADSLHPELDQKHSFKLGAHLQHADAVIGYNRPPLPNTEIDIEDLGVDDDYTSGYLRYNWRFAERWSLNATGQRYSGKGRIGVQDEFNWDGEIIPVGARLDTELKVDTYILDVLYSAIKTDRAELAIGGGLHAFDIKTVFDIAARVGTEFERERRETTTFLAPLPNVRVKGVYAFTSQWTVEAIAGWLDVTIDDYSGQFAYGTISTEYRFTRGFGAGLGYQLTYIDVIEETDRKKLRFDMTFTGPLLFLRFAF